MSSPQNKKIYKIILADDHPILLKGMKALLSEDEQLQIIAECTDGQKLIEETIRLKPNLILCDLSMPKMNGLDAIREIKKKLGDVKVIILTIHKEKQIFEKALQLGVDGYVLKEDIYDQLKFTIHTVLNGGKSYSAKITEAFAIGQGQERSELTFELLTRREREILRLAALGRTNREIGEELGISVRTVETHRANLMQKLDLKNVQELIAFAIKHGVVSIDEMEA